MGHDRRSRSWASRPCDAAGPRSRWSQLELDRITSSDQSEGVFDVRKSVTPVWASIEIHELNLSWPSTSCRLIHGISVWDSGGLQTVVLSRSGVTVPPRKGHHQID
jgi:hypothetical protein